MIIQRKLFAKSDMAKGMLVSGGAGAIGGAFLGNSIGRKIAKRKFIKNFNPEEEEKKLKSLIKDQEDWIKEVKSPEMKKLNRENYEFDYDPKFQKELLEGHKKSLEKLKKDPKEYAKEVSSSRIKSNRGTSIGAGLGLAAGSTLGAIAVKNKEKIEKAVEKHPSIVLGPLAAGAGAAVVNKIHKNKKEKRELKKREEERIKELSKYTAPIHDTWEKNLSKGQREHLREEEKDRGKLDLYPYLRKLEKDHKLPSGSVKAFDYDRDEDIIKDFKNSRRKSGRIGSGLVGGTLGTMAGIAHGAIKHKSQDKAVLHGLGGAAIGTAAGLLAGGKISDKYNGKLIKEALENRKQESEIKLKKK